MKSLIISIGVLAFLFAVFIYYKVPPDPTYEAFKQPAESAIPVPSTKASAELELYKIGFDAMKWRSQCNAGMKDPRLPIKVASGTRLQIFHEEATAGTATSGTPVWKCGKLFISF